jgi:hypothetical protein
MHLDLCFFLKPTHSNSWLLHKKVLEEMHWNTHDRLTGMLRPGTDPSVIYRVNRALDNPDPWAIRLNQSMKNMGYSHAFDVPGLKKYPQTARP